MSQNLKNRRAWRLRSPQLSAHLENQHEIGQIGETLNMAGKLSVFSHQKETAAERKKTCPAIMAPIRR